MSRAVFIWFCFWYVQGTIDGTSAAMSNHEPQESSQDLFYTRSQNRVYRALVWAVLSQGHVVRGVAPCTVWTQGRTGGLLQSGTPRGASTGNIPGSSWFSLRPMLHYATRCLSCHESTKWAHCLEAVVVLIGIRTVLGLMHVTYYRFARLLCPKVG